MDTNEDLAIQESKWISAYGSVIGSSHIAQEIACQDVCYVFPLHNSLVTIVADGAGSAANSHLGANVVCMQLAYHLEDVLLKEEWFMRDVLPRPQDWEQISTQILATVRFEIERYSINKELPYPSLASTVIFAVTMTNGLLVGHIGDGRAGYCNFDDEWFPMITPFKGELANETVFITSDIWNEGGMAKYIETRVIESDVKAFCLLTDGCEKAAFECNLYEEETKMFHDPNRPFKEFFDKNVNQHLPNFHRSGMTQTEINGHWEKFLTAGNEKLRIESDDKTMILAVKIKE